MFLILPRWNDVNSVNLIDNKILDDFIQLISGIGLVVDTNHI